MTTNYTVSFKGLRPGEHTAIVTADAPLPNVVPATTTVRVSIPEPPRPVPVVARRRDPLAQTFEMPQDEFLTKVQLRFSAAPPAPVTTAEIGEALAADPPVYIEIREVQEGIPTDLLVGERAYAFGNTVRENLVSRLGITDFEFETPVLLREGQRYAIVVKTDSPAYEIYYAELGQLELGTSNRVTTQPYPEGTLLQSSDDVSWDPLPNRDLWFRMYFAKFTTSQETFEFEPIVANVANVVGFRLSAKFNLLQQVKSGIITQIGWEYSTAALADSENWSSWKPIQPFSNEFTENTFQKVKFRVLLRGGYNASTGLSVSPLIDRESLAVEFFSRKSDSRLVSKPLTLAAPYRYVRIIAKQWLPSSAAKITWYISDGTLATTPTAYAAGTSYATNSLVTYQLTTYMALESTSSVPGPSNTAWVEVELLNNMIWRLVPATDEIKLPAAGMESGWTEHERQVTLPASSTRTKFYYMFKLNSQNVAKAPALKDVICILNG